MVLFEASWLGVTVWCCACVGIESLVSFAGFGLVVLYLLNSVVVYFDFAMCFY